MSTLIAVEQKVHTEMFIKMKDNLEIHREILEVDQDLVDKEEVVSGEHLD